MNVSARIKRWALGTGLVITCVAALWPVSDEPKEGATAIAMTRASPAPSASSRGSATRGANGSSAPAAVLPDRSAWAQTAIYRDPFKGVPGLDEAPAASTVASAPARAASAPPAPPPPPPAPTVPWPYAGRLLVPGQPDAVLLHDGTRTVPLALGQTLGDWRLDADRGQQLDFTHLPTGAAVVLPISP